MLAVSQKTFPVTTVILLSSINDYTLPCLGSTGRVPGRAKSIQSSFTVVQIEPSVEPSIPVRCSSPLRVFKDTIAAMPSYLRNSHRSYSFPPCIDSVDFDHEEGDFLPDIDEDPFSHFISPINEEDDPYDLSLSAGIIVPDGPRTNKASKFKSNVAEKWARYVQYHHTPLHAQYHTPAIQEEDEEDEESFMGLDDDRLNNTPSVMSQISPPRIVITEPTRGRAQELAARKAQNRRRYSRTLSGHRHSWREPSPDLFDIDESEEEEGSTLKRTKTRKAKDGAERRMSLTRAQPWRRGDIAERSKL
jgi:hypothetical protein